MQQDLKKLIGVRVRAAREAQKLTQERLAELSQLSTKALQNIERGTSLAPLDTLQSICGALGIKLIAMLEDPLSRDPTIFELSARISAEISQLSHEDAELAYALIQTLRKARS